MKPLLSLFITSCILAISSVSNAAWQSPLTLDGATTITTEEAVALHKEGVPFIDVRSARQYNKRHIPGAHHLFLHEGLTESNLLKVVAKNEWMVIYCNGAHCSLSSRSIEKIRPWGFTKLYYYRDGMREWRMGGNPVESNIP